MPHVVVRGDVSLSDFHAEFEAFEGARDRVILKITDAYLNHDDTLILLESLVVDRRPKGFLIVLDHRGDRATIRLYPRTDPEKCDGVRRLLAIVAERVLNQFPGSEVVTTNLAPFFATNDVIAWPPSRGTDVR